MYSLEGPLIREYWSQPNPQRRRSVIRDYARLMHMSDGRAQDALDPLGTPADPGNSENSVTFWRKAMPKFFACHSRSFAFIRV